MTTRAPDSVATLPLTPAVQRSLVARLQAGWAAFRGPGAPDPAGLVDGDFNAFLGPGTPPTPTVVQTPAEERAPRRWQYPIGGNLSQTPRAAEGLTPLAQLRSLATSYDVAGICIKFQEDELKALDWHLVPLNGSDKTAAARLAPQIQRLTATLQKPDGDLLFDQWIAMLLREDLELGAPYVYKHRTRGGAPGPLEIIQGDLLIPRVDVRGRTLCYDQQFQGQMLWRGAAADVIYCPRMRRRNSVYGISPIELVLLTVNRAIREQTAKLAHYTEGNIPPVLAGFPESWTPDMMREFFELWDSLLAGNDSQRAKIHPWPGDTSKIFQLRPLSERPEQEEWLLKITCAALGVKPEEIGFTAHITRATAEQQQAGQHRTGLIPIAKWAEAVMTYDVLHAYYGATELRFAYDLGGHIDDRLTRARADDLNIKNHVYGPATVRARDGVEIADGDQAWAEGGPAASAPGLPPSSAAGAPVAPPDGAPADPGAADAVPPPANVLLLYTHGTLHKVRALNAALDTLTKAAKGPGSRGGHYWIDAHGQIRYGAKPVGRKHAAAHPPAAAHPATAERQAAAASARAQLAAQHAAEQAARTAGHDLAQDLRQAAREAAMDARQAARLAAVAQRAAERAVRDALHQQAQAAAQAFREAEQLKHDAAREQARADHQAAQAAHATQVAQAAADRQQRALAAAAAKEVAASVKLAVAEILAQSKAAALTAKAQAAQEKALAHLQELVLKLAAQYALAALKAQLAQEKLAIQAAAAAAKAQAHAPATGKSGGQRGHSGTGAPSAPKPPSARAVRATALAELKAATVLADLTATGWAQASAHGADKAAANAAATTAGHADPTHFYAVVHLGGQYLVVRKAISAFAGANTITAPGTAPPPPPGHHPAGAPPPAPPHHHHHKAAEAAELRKWQEKALRRVRVGKAAGVNFESPDIPESVYDRVLHGLTQATTGDAVRAVFAPYLSAPD